MVRNKKNPVKRPEEISCRSCAFQLELFVAANSWPRDVSCEVNPWGEIKSVFWGFLKTGYPYSQWLIIMFPTEIPFLGVYCAPFSDTPMYPPTPPTARGSASEKTLQSARGKTWWEQPARAREREADKRRKQGARASEQGGSKRDKEDESKQDKKQEQSATGGKPEQEAKGGAKSNEQQARVEAWN